MCDFFRSTACSGSCANEILKKMHEDGMIVFDTIDCRDCEYNTGQHARGAGPLRMFRILRASSMFSWRTEVRRMLKSEWTPQAEELLSRFKRWRDICQKQPHCTFCPIRTACRGMGASPAWWTGQDLRLLTRRFLHLE